MPPSASALRRATAVAAGVTALFFAAGCGNDSDSGGSGNDDEATIEAVAVKAVTSTDVEERCVETVTDGFVTEVFGDLATCRAAAAPEPDDEPPTGATVADIEVDGDAATAKVTEQGGDTDGATGTLTFERDGEDWKISELGVDLLRSQLSTGLLEGEFDSSDGPLQDETVRTCLDDGLQGLDDDEFREVAYSGIRDEEEPAPQFLRVFTECTAETGAGGSEPDPGADSGTDPGSGSGGTGSEDSGADSGGDEELSLLRRQFESGIRESAERDGAPAEQIDCVLRATRDTISEDDIVEQVGRGADNVDPELSQRVARAIQKCG